MSSLIQRFADRGRVQIEKAAYASRNRLVQRQTRRDLNHFWIRLGKTAFHLTEAGEIEHPALRKAMARIQHLQDEIAAGHNYDDGTGAPGPRKSSDSRP